MISALDNHRHIHVNKLEQYEDTVQDHSLTNARFLLCVGERHCASRGTALGEGGGDLNYQSNSL